MKKIQVIFAAVALMLAGVGVYANTLNSFVYFENQISGASCTGTVVSAICNITDPNPCFQDKLNEETNQIERYFYSRQELNGSGVPIACLQLKQP